MTRYARPETLTDALQLLEGGTWRILAGGTDLYPGAGAELAGDVLDIGRVPGLRGISLSDGLRIGAATTWSDIAAAPLPPALFALQQAAVQVGARQVQNTGTIGGNLCNASPAADSVPALVAAGATCLIVGPGGTREVPVEAIPAGPGKTALAPGEVVVEIRLPAQTGGDAYLRSIPRTEMDIAVVGAGVSLVIDASGICTAARVAVGAVAPTVVLVADAGTALVGTRLDDAALDRMADAVRAACRPIDDKRGTAEYRTAMAGVLARRTVRIARDRAQHNQGRR